MDHDGAEITLGQRVAVQGKLQGVVRHFGTTSFKEGSWVGVELDEPRGKNDGSVAGVAYFSCAPNHGLFIRPCLRCAAAICWSIFLRQDCVWVRCCLMWLPHAALGTLSAPLAKSCLQSFSASLL